MDPRLVPPLPPGCPWSGWPLPDIKHCEANACGWVTAPVDTWSNLGFLLVGLMILRSDRDGGALDARGLGAVTIAVGLTSMAFHASYTFAGQALDFAGMFLLIGWVLARAARREGLLGRNGAARLWAGLTAGSVAALFAFRAAGWAVQTIMLVQALAAAAWELRLLLVRRDAPSARALLAMTGLLAAAYACWHLDHSSLCRPDALFQFHALWHLLCAAALWAAWRHHRGVDESARIRA